MKKNVAQLLEKKKTDQKISVLTCYDACTAALMHEADVDILLVGDSVGTNILGYSNETEVTMDDMIHHIKAVRRGAPDAFIVGDLPYQTHETIDNAIENAKRFITAGADSVKFEGIKPNITKALVEQGIIVMCHIGLNPQYDQERIKQGRITHGKEFNEALHLLKGAQDIQDAGAHFLVLEKIPERVSKIITENYTMSTIGIGAGRFCDGQVLVINDILGFTDKTYKHVKKYNDAKSLFLYTIQSYVSDVRLGIFPQIHHTNAISDERFNKIKEWAVTQGLKVV